MTPKCRRDRVGIVRGQGVEDLDMIAITPLDRAGLRHGDTAVIKHERVEIDDEVREQRIGRASVDRKMKLAIANEEVNGIPGRLFLNRQRSFEPQQGLVVDPVRRFGDDGALNEQPSAMDRIRYRKC